MPNLYWSLIREPIGVCKMYADACEIGHRDYLNPEHFIDKWAKIISVTDLPEKVDKYENVRKFKIIDRGKRNRPSRNFTAIKTGFYASNWTDFTNGKFGNYGENKRFLDAKSYEPNKQFICFNCGKARHLVKLCRNQKNMYQVQRYKIKIQI